MNHVSLSVDAKAALGYRETLSALGRSYLPALDESADQIEDLALICSRRGGLCRVEAGGVELIGVRESGGNQLPFWGMGISSGEMGRLTSFKRTCCFSATASHRWRALSFHRSFSLSSAAGPPPPPPPPRAAAPAPPILCLSSNLPHSLCNPRSSSSCSRLSVMSARRNRAEEARRFRCGRVWGAVEERWERSSVGEFETGGGA